MTSSNPVLTLRFLAEPGDVNFGGKVHGGAVMKWIDQAGYACAVAWSGSYCVTAYVGGIRFTRPILIGSLVEVEARLAMTGRSSMHIVVDVRAGDPREGKLACSTHCVMQFVAVDESGVPTAVPVWEPQSEEDHHRRRFVKRLLEMRQDIDRELACKDT